MFGKPIMYAGKTFFFVSLLGISLLIVALPVPGTEPPAEGVRTIANRLEPIVDGWLVDQMKNTTYRLHSPSRREVVFTFDAPWEGGQSGYVSVLHDGDQYRLYYRGGGDLSREYTCVAFSNDAIHWTRPKLGLIEFNGSKANNIIWTGKRKAYDESHNFSPFIDTNPVAKPEERYKAVSAGRKEIGGETKRVLFAFSSPDGLQWKRLQEEPIITEGGFDSHNVVFWDAEQKQYVCFLRAAQEGKRSIARSTSKDFRTWTTPRLLDFSGTPIEQFYTNGIVPYFRAPHVYLGFPMRFVPPKERDTVGADPRKTDGLSDAVFMSSRDGLRWSRLFMEAFIRPGLDPKNWGGAHGNSTPACGLVQSGKDEMAIFWAEHYDNYPAKEITPQLRRGSLRLDGFISVNAPYPGGEFTTHPLRFSGSTLTINCSTSAIGSIQVEVQTAAGKPIPGYSLNDSLPIWGDEVERLVAWKPGTDVSKLSAQPVRLRFVMKDADLFAVRFK